MLARDFFYNMFVFSTNNAVISNNIRIFAGEY